MRPKNLEYLNVSMADADDYGPDIAFAIAYIRYRREKAPNWKPSRRFLMQDIGIGQRQADKASVIWRITTTGDTSNIPSWMPERVVNKLTSGYKVNQNECDKVNHEVEHSEQESGYKVNQKVVNKLTTGSNINKEISLNKANSEFSLPISFPPLYPLQKTMAQRRAGFFHYLYTEDKPYFFLPHLLEVPEVSKLVWEALNLSSMPDHEERDCLRMAISVMDTNPIGSTFPEVLVNALVVTLANVCDRYDASWDDLTKSRQHNMREVQRKLNDLLNPPASVDFPTKPT